MRISQFAELCCSQLIATSKISKINLTPNDFCRLFVTFNKINACDKRATKVVLKGETFSFNELSVPSCFKEMVYPSVLTPNGDLDSEADFLIHSYFGIIDIDVDVDEFDGYELARFNSTLYNSWKSDVESVLVSDIRVPASMSAEAIKATCNKGLVPAAGDRSFPMNVKFDLASDEVAKEEINVVLKRWIVKTLNK